MRAAAFARFVLTFGSALALASPAFLLPAPASADTGHEAARHGAKTHATAVTRHATAGRAGRGRRAAGLQCVPFARAESGIALRGNAANWWEAAAGVYARGSKPEAGAVLNFRPTGGMRLGHVAVVTNVLSPREIEIDHANWTRFAAARGNVSLAMRVIDVSPNNDWTAVRVELGHSGDFGAVYPTYGFIYDRPDTGTMLANTLTDPHPTTERPALDMEEVAEAPPGPRNARAVEALPVDAPEHTLR